jgi:hypothetical protein
MQKKKIESPEKKDPSCSCGVEPVAKNSPDVDSIQIHVGFLIRQIKFSSAA